MGERNILFVCVIDSKNRLGVTMRDREEEEKYREIKSVYVYFCV